MTAVRPIRRLAVLVLMVALATIARADDTDAGDAEPPAGPPTVEYSRDGLELRSRDGSFRAHIDWRVQFRLTESLSGDDDVGSSPEVREGQFAVQRGRFKLGGHAYGPWLTYYFEYDFPSSRLLDFRFAIEKHSALRFRVGQWKVRYNRERVDSSGKQQFVERSIVNDPFTLDRQQGLALFGRLWKERRADSWYHLAVFSGTGRGGEGSIDRPMIVGRWQWNFLGRDLKNSQSDTGYREAPAASIAVAGAGWRGPYTAFSSAGGGQLPGFETGGDDRYDVEQTVLETAFQFRGFSWQQEYHRKSVDDTETGAVTDLEGGYAQFGTFPHAWVAAVPAPLEIAVRYAWVDPDTASPDDDRTEATLVVNWFFHGHRNKLTADVSRIRDRSLDVGDRDLRRIRVQWDVSF